MEKGKQTENKYRMLQQEYRELKTENKELKAKEDELKNQLKLREEVSKTARGRTSILKDEDDSPEKKLERTFHDLMKSQENNLMNAIANGQQQSERKFAEFTVKLDKANDKMDTANDKLETATARIDSLPRRLTIGLMVMTAVNQRQNTPD